MAKVLLRGIPELEARADELVADIRAGPLDGLEPAAREEQRQLRADVRFAYSTSQVARRTAVGAASSAATGAVVSLAVQYLTEGEIDGKRVGRSAAVSAVYGAGGVLADAGLYQLATRWLGYQPEAAKAFAQGGVASGFCVLAIATDLVSEARAVRRGDVAAAGAIGGGAFKVGLDVLPLAMTPLGPVAFPIAISAQVGGRLLLERRRHAQRTHLAAIDADLALVAALDERMTSFGQRAEEALAECDETDALVDPLMSDASGGLAAAGAS